MTVKNIKNSIAIVLELVLAVHFHRFSVRPRFLLSIYDSNESIDFVLGKSKNLY
jgi:hypothetical protein